MCVCVQFPSFNDVHLSNPESGGEPLSVKWKSVRGKYMYAMCLLGGFSIDLLVGLYISSSTY